MNRLRQILTAIAFLTCVWGSATAQPSSLPPQAAERVGVRTTPAAERGRVVPGRFIVILEPKVDPRAVARAHRIEPKYFYTNVLNGFAGPMSELARSGLLRDNRIVRVEPVRPVRATAAANSWGIDRIDQRALPLDGTYSTPTSGSGITAYVVDTGIRFDHAIFGGRATRGIDVVNDGQNGNDCDGHGTHVAGTIGGGYGYGVAPAVRLVAARVLDCDGSGASSGVIAALDWIAKNGQRPAVVNMSLGGDADYATDTAVKNLVAAGFTVVVAAGNDGADACQFSPARAPAAITVGATSRADSRTSWSNYGSCVDLFAPGDSIVSSWASSSTALASSSGTSMASPHVAGAAALILSGNPSASPSAVWNTLDSSATPGIVASAASSNDDLLFVGSSTDAPVQTISLEAGVAFVSGGARVTLNWTRATGSSVDVYRNGTKILNTPNDGAWATTTSAQAVYKYKVCNANSSQCSPEVTVSTLPTTAATPSISLQATVTRLSSGARVTLMWSGATSSTVDVYRDGRKIANTANDGAWSTSTRTRGKYRYRICNSGSSSVCSAEVSVTV